VISAQCNLFQIKTIVVFKAVERRTFGKTAREAWIVQDLEENARGYRGVAKSLNTPSMPTL
jgi:hypothetical protein